MQQPTPYLFLIRPAILAGMATATKSASSSRKKKNKDVDYDRLCTAVNAAYRSLKPFRDNRAAAVREYAGNHYGTRGPEERVPLNLLSIYVQVMTRLLVAKLPRVMISTFDKQMKSCVRAAETWTNEKLVEMGFEETLERWVVDAFFSVGIMKVALSTPNDSATNNWELDAGDPFAEVIDLDDFVFDVHARRFSQATFVGHRLRIQKDVLLEDDKIDAKVRKRLGDETDQSNDNNAGADAEDRVRMLQKGEEVSSDGGESEFEEFVDCVEIYLPRRGIMCLFLWSDIQGMSGKADPGKPCCEPIKVMPWIGPKCGPYHFLGLGLIPDNAMPKGPIQDLYDLHIGFNKLLRKSMRQAERQKTVYAARAAADKDGNRVMQASDGDIIIVDDPSGIVPLGFPGADAALVQFAMMLKDLFDFMAGNLTTLTGRAPAAPTATQEKILAAGSSAQVDDSAQRVLRSTGHVLRSLFWFWWHDPFKTLRSNLSIPGMPEISTISLVKPEDREKGSYDDLSIKIDAYSMQPQTPQTRIQAIMSVVQTLFLPLAQMAQQQGVYLDMQTLFDKLAHYMDQPDLADVLSIQAPPDSAGSMGGDSAATDTGVQPAKTERTYNRVSTSEKTAQGEANGRINAMGAAQANGKPGGPGY